MLQFGNMKDIDICVNTGKIGAKNTFVIKVKSESDYAFLSGCLDSFIKSLCLMTTYTSGNKPIDSLGNTTGIKVTALNTGWIGSGNSYQVESELFLVLLGRYEQFISDSLLVFKNQSLPLIFDSLSRSSYFNRRSGR